MKCVFCEEEYFKRTKIYEDELIWAFPSYIPITVGHTLIVPKRCVAKFSDLTQEEREAIWELAEKIKRSLEKNFAARGFNVAYNENRIAGQSVDHFHLHIVPRKEGDDGIHGCDPRKFIYRTDKRDISPSEELDEVADKIKKGI